MSTTNAQRHDLHSGLEEVLAAQRAETLMDYLPSVGRSGDETLSVGTQQLLGLIR